MTDSRKHDKGTIPTVAGKAREHAGLSSSSPCTDIGVPDRYQTALQMLANVEADSTPPGIVEGV
jgi:hypothetical protein